MSPFRAVPRAPQATSLSDGSPTSPTTSAHPVPTSSPGSGSTSWDTRVGSQIYSTDPISSAQTSTLSDGSAGSPPGGLLSSKASVVGLCVGIAVLCVLIALFLVYRAKYGNNPKQANASTSKSSLPDPPDSHSSKTAQGLDFRHIHPRSQHPLEEEVSRSTSSVRPPNKLSSMTPPAERSPYRPGDVMEISPMAYPHPDSLVSPSTSVSAYAPAPRRSESGAVGIITDHQPYSLPSRSLERLSSTTAVSVIESSSYTSRSHLIPPLQSSETIKPLHSSRRPLPIPPHPPPAYEQVSGSKAVQTPSTVPDTETKSAAHPYLNTVWTSSGIQPPQVKVQEQKKEVSIGDAHPSVARPEVVASHPTNADTRLSLHDGPAFLRRSRKGNDPALNGAAEDYSALDMEEEGVSSRSHRRHLSDGDQDPFLNINYELPAWLSSDPYPAQALRPSASQPSLYSATARSVAASSRVLPSDSSIRTLTPEPTSPPPIEASGNVESDQDGKSRHSRAPTYTTLAPSSRPRSAVVGDGPSVEKVLVLQGAERPGWAENSPLRFRTSFSRNRRKFPTDGFEPDDLHPAASAKRWKVPLPLSPPPAAPGCRSAEKEGTFADWLPLSNGFPGQGLGRAFTLDTPRRKARGARDRGRLPGSPALAKTFSNFSSLHSSTQGSRTGTSSSFEHGGWLEKERVPPSAGANSVTDRGRESVVPSSGLLPSEVASIRSISPEFGWMGEPQPPTNGQAHELTVIEEGEPGEFSHKAIPETTVVEGDSTRVSIGEDGVLWGRLTSAMEQEQQLLEHPT